MSYLRVKENPNLVRDTKSSAILQTSQDDLNKYRKERENAIKEKERQEKLDRIISLLDKLERIDEIFDKLTIIEKKLTNDFGS